MSTLIKALILLSTSYIVGCVEQSSYTSYGSYLSLRNNTFGYNDFRVSDSGSFIISYGAIDFGRNLYRDSNNPHDYNDSIGYIYLDGQGSGHIEFVNQDSLYHLIGFSYTKNETKGNSLSLNFQFDEVPVVTYSSTQPLSEFEYTQHNDSWRYETLMSKYSGDWIWQYNRLSIL